MVKKLGILILICAFVAIPAAVLFADVGKVTDPEAQKELQDLKAAMADLQGVVQQQQGVLANANKTIAALSSELADVKARPAVVQQAAPEAAPAAAPAGAGEVVSGPGTKLLSIGGYGQVDYHAGDGVKTSSSINTFDLRRLYIDFKGQVADNLDYRIILATATSTSDANVSLLWYTVTLKNIDLLALASGDVGGMYNPESTYLNLLVGRSLIPFGIEGSLSAKDYDFVEVATVTALSPGYGLGARAFGDFFNKRLGYSVGLYNNVTSDNGGVEDVDDSKAFVARISATPLQGEVAGLQSSVKLGTSFLYENVSNGTIVIPQIDNLMRANATTGFYGEDARFGVDGEINVGRLQLRSELIRALFDPNRDYNQSGPGLDSSNFDPFSAWGYYVQAGFFVLPAKLQLLYRWEMIEGDEIDSSLEFDDIQIHTAGISYWFTPYQKLMLNYAYLPQGYHGESKQGEFLARYQMIF